MAWNQNGHSPAAKTSNTELRTTNSRLRILAIVEATNVNAVAKNMFEFHRAADELRQQSNDAPAIDLSLVTFDRGQDSAEFVAAARELGLAVDVIHERGRFDTTVISALRKIVAQRAPDVVVTHQVKSHFLMRLSRLWQEHPWVAFNHGYTTTDRKMRLYNRLDRWSLPTADRVVTVCDAFTQKLVKMGVPRERIRVQHNSIRPEPAVGALEMCAFRKQLSVKEDERMILTVGRLSKEKAHIDLLRAFKNLRDTSTTIKARLVIVGDGPEREALKATAASLGLGDRVIFAGQVSDVRSYYAIADVLVNPSHSEGSPYVLLEAMAASLPIVATAVGGVPEIVASEESALLVPANDPRALAAAVVRILTGGALARRLTTNASALITERFAPETYVRSLVDTYLQVIDRRTNTVR